MESASCENCLNSMISDSAASKDISKWEWPTDYECWSGDADLPEDEQCFPEYGHFCTSYIPRNEAVRR